MAQQEVITENNLLDKVNDVASRAEQLRIRAELALLTHCVANSTDQPSDV